MGGDPPGSLQAISPMVANRRLGDGVVAARSIVAVVVHLRIGKSAFTLHMLPIRSAPPAWKVWALAAVEARKPQAAKAAAAIRT